MTTLQNKLVLITGASAGIGAATAKALAQRGARVALLARTEAALQTVATAIRQGGGQAHVYPVDVTQPEAVARVVAQVTAELGAPDIVINSAGVGRWLFTEETAPAEVQQMIGAPYLAAFYVTHFCLPAMLQRRSGTIVNINSPVARGGWPGATGYTAARYALQGFTQALWMDLHGTGVRCLSVVPGKTTSEYFTRNAGADVRVPRIANIVPTVTPEQVAQAVVWGLEHDAREVVLPFMLQLVFIFQHLFPWLMEWLMVQTGWRHGGK